MLIYDIKPHPLMMNPCDQETQDRWDKWVTQRTIDLSGCLIVTSTNIQKIFEEIKEKYKAAGII